MRGQVMRGLKVLALAGLLAPALSACVIYDSTASDNVRVNVTRNDAPAAETIRGARIDDGALIVLVSSNGCTTQADFEVSVADNRQAEVTVRRIKEDICRSLVAVPDVELRWTYVDLGIEAGSPVRIINPLK